MNGKRAKELRRVAMALSDGNWRDYVAIRQRDTFGRPVRPQVAEGLSPILDDSGNKVWGPDGKRVSVAVTCVLRTGHEIRLDETCGQRMYRRMKTHYKRNKSKPELYERQRELLREVA